MIAHGAVVPHAPVLLEEIQPSLDEGRRVRKAVDELDFSNADVVVLVSPHGPTAGIYERCEGSLRGFGIDDAEASRGMDTGLSRALSLAWGPEPIDGPVDFGIVVPLLLGVGGDLPIVAASLPQTTGPRPRSLSDSIAAATGLAGALATVAGERAIAVVASAHSSAGLSARAPLTEVSGAAEVDREVVEALEADPARIENLLGPLHEVGQACGVGPLSVLGRLLEGWRSEGLTYEAPYGVGYMVGQWSS
jgi:aromatic ring-opening dioxygenase LigB subunit